MHPRKISQGTHFGSYIAFEMCISATQMLFKKHGDKVIPLRLTCVGIGQGTELIQ